MKNVLFLIFLVIASTTNGQSYYLETETRMEGAPAMFAKLAEMKTKTFSGLGKTLTITEAAQGKFSILIEGDLQTYVNGKDCYTDTRKNIAEANNEQMQYKDVRVEKSTKSKTILGHDCKSAIIYYTTSNVGLSTNQSLLVWYAPGLKNKFDAQEEKDLLEKENPLSKALLSLDGMVLSTETITGSYTLIMEVTKLEEKTFKEEDFKIDTKKCSKMLTYKQFVTEMNKKNARGSIYFGPTFRHW